MAGVTTTVTLRDGYEYRVSAGPVAAVTTEVANSVQPQDAPPGTAFLQTALTTTNPTDRAEPLDPLAKIDPGGSGPAVSLAIPMAEAAAFAPDCEWVSPATNVGDTANVSEKDVPDGFCVLGTAVSTIDGPHSSGPDTVQMSPGDVDTVVVYAVNPVHTQHVDLRDVAVFVGDTPPLVQLAGPTHAAATTDHGDPVSIGSSGAVVFLSRTAINVATDPDAPRHGGQFTTKVTISNPGPVVATIDNLTATVGNPSSTIEFTVPRHDLGALQLDDSAIDCGLAAGAPTDDTCVLGAYFTATATTLAPGASATFTIDGRDAFHTGFPPTAPVADVRLLFRYPTQPLIVDIPQAH